MKTVKQMKQSIPTGKLLSNYSADFWEEYKNNSTHYDSYFVTLYKSFVFFDQEENETVEQVTNNFINTVENYLRANDKRLTELWRINVVPDDETYSITENYYMKEIYSGNTTSQGSITTGQRTDINNVNVGSQSFENVDKVSAFNGNTESTKASNGSVSSSRNDIDQFTKGQETDTSQSVGTDGHTLTRHGALGVMTVTDVLKKQEDYWKNTQIFYELVFREICEKFLLVGCD